MRLHVEQHGNEGPLCVLIHGWGMHGGLWSPLLPELAQQRRVRVIDLPGHGQSPYAGDGRLATWSAAIADTVDEPADVVAWSLGGALALHWALQTPSALRSLTLVSASPCFTRRPDWPCAIDGATLAQFRQDLQQDYRTTLNHFLGLQARGGEDERGVLKALRRSVFDRGEPDPGALRDGLTLLQETDLRPALEGLRVPLHLIHGERDRVVPADAARWLAARVPDCRLVLIDGAAHAPQVSHPRATLAALADT